MEAVTLVRVFIAGPSDTFRDVDTVRRCVHNWNRDEGKGRKVVILPLHWKHDRPIDSNQSPQSSIDEALIDKCDICVALYWHRIGESDYPGRTAREIDAFRNAGAPVMVYFCERPHPDSAEPEQVKALARYREETASSFDYGTFDSDSTLSERLYNSLTHLTEKLIAGERLDLDGTWLEIKDQQARPYSLVEISNSRDQAPDIKGVSYTSDGSALVTWPAEINAAWREGNTVYHVHDALYEGGKALGFSQFHFWQDTFDRIQGEGFYIHHAGATPGSTKVHYKLKRVSRKMRAHFGGGKGTHEANTLIPNLHKELLQQRYVLTGGSFSGKTQIIERLRELNYAVVPESAIAVLDELHRELGTREDALAWRRQHPVDFQRRVFLKQIEFERDVMRSLSQPTAVFYDRTGIDCIAYLNDKGQQQVPAEIQDYAHSISIEKVFVLDTLEPFDARQDTMRESTYEDSIRIRRRLLEAYRTLNYPTSVIGHNQLGEEHIARRVDSVLDAAGRPPPSAERGTD